MGNTKLRTDSAILNVEELSRREAHTKLRAEWVAKLKARTAEELSRREALRRKHGRTICQAREVAGARLPCVRPTWVEIEGVPLCFAHSGAVTVYGRPLADVLDGVPRKRGDDE